MLSSLIWIPILGALAIALLPPSLANRARRVALVVTGGVTLWSLWLLAQFNLTNPGLQFQEYLPWIETLGLNYQLGADGLSIVLLALNSFLTWIAIYL
ncbi:MAG: hypothetical protein F6K28_60910 [Microcoleus sp. SIO2G3]|nr:hypothetical protein [Microcoleus sp. SIO2G3]